MSLDATVIVANDLDHTLEGVLCGSVPQREDCDQADRYPLQEWKVPA